MASIQLKLTLHKANPLQPPVKAQHPEIARSDPVIHQRSKRDEYKWTYPTSARGDQFNPFWFFTNNFYNECWNINIHSSSSATCSGQTQALPPLLQSCQDLVADSSPTGRRLKQEDPHTLSFQAGGTSEFSAVPGLMIHKHAALTWTLSSLLL